MDREKRRYFRLQAIPYAVINGVLCRRYFHGIFLRCIEPDQIDKLLEEFHNGSLGGHFAASTTTLKIMRAGYYWLDLFKDTFSWVKRCEKCALFAGKQKLATFPLHPIQVEQPFAKWGLYFIGPINPPSSAGHKWILIATNYFTKWIEVVALKEANKNSILNFYQNLVSRFGTPNSIISNNYLAFISLKIFVWSVKNNIFLNTSSNYYLHGNGQEESTNKNLIKIIKKNIEDNQRTWHEKLKLALWDDRITPKRATSCSPYVLTYGKEAKLPIFVEFPTLNFIKELELLEEQPMGARLAQLMELEETRKEELRKLEIHQAHMKSYFEKRARPRDFTVGNLVFKWDEHKSKPGKHSKFDVIWDGPYMIIECKKCNSFQLSKLSAECYIF